MGGVCSRGRERLKNQKHDLPVCLSYRKQGEKKGKRSCGQEKKRLVGHMCRGTEDTKVLKKQSVLQDNNDEQNRTKGTGREELGVCCQ